MDNAKKVSSLPDNINCSGGVLLKAITNLKTTIQKFRQVKIKMNKKIESKLYIIL